MRQAGGVQSVFPAVTLRLILGEYSTAADPEGREGQAEPGGRSVTPLAACARLRWLLRPRECFKKGKKAGFLP